MIVKINSTTYETVGNVKLMRTKKQARDDGSITIKNTRAQRYEMYDKVDITTLHGVEQYLVNSDTKSQISSTRYQHDLKLIENIAYFDTVFPASRSFKIIGQTLEDILNAYKRELEAYHDVLISYTTIPQAVLDTVISFKEYDGISFSQILQSLFTKLDAKAKVNRIGDTWDIYPSYDNEKNDLITRDTTVSLNAQNSSSYATKVKSQLKNAVNERDINEVSWFPSESGYVLPRSSSVEKITSNLRYELDSKIIAILKGIIATDITVEVLRLSDSQIIEIQITDIDITNQIVQEAVYENLTVITSTIPNTIALTNNIKNNIRYKANDRYITDLFAAGTGGIVFNANTTYLINAIERELYLNWQAYIDDTLYSYEDIVTTGLDTEDIGMRFKYVKQRDLDLVSSRKTKGNMNLSTALHKQRDASINLNDYKNNLKIFSNRMGNNEETCRKVFQNGDTPFQLSDYTSDEKVVTTIINTFKADDYVVCEYELSDSFANIDGDSALRRRNDPYSITEKSLTTNLVAQEYVEFSITDRTDASRLTSNAQRLLLGLFEATTIPLDKVAHGVFKPVLASWNSNYAIQMPVESSGNGNLITLHVYFENNVIAAKTYYDLDTDTYKDYLNALPYTDDGNLTNFELYFTSDVLFEDSGQYPLILDETNYLANELTESGFSEPIDLDQSDSFAYTFEVLLIADENIYIGNALSNKSYLIKDQLTSTSIKIYTSTKPYGEMDQVPRTYDTDDTLNVSYSYSFANKTISITPSSDIDYFSIVKDGEILLALNQMVLAGQTLVIHINFVASLNTIYLEARVVGLADFAATASLAYSFRIYYLEALSAVLSDFQATASLEYTARTYYIEALSNELSAFSGTASIEYTTRNYDLEALSGALSNFAGTASIEYTTRSYDLEAKSIALSSFSGTASFAYTTISYDLSALSSPLSDIRGTARITVPAPLVEWQIVSSGTVTGGTCLFETDLGNIKEETNTTCSFVNDGPSYESGTDLSEPEPACSTGQTYTLCFLFEGTYFCQDYIGQETTTTTKYECVLK